MGGSVTGVIWHGTRCRALRQHDLSQADELTSRNMWNNNDRKPADRFSNITPHDPQTVSHIKRWAHYCEHMMDGSLL